jgi:hypothetical protein
LSIHTDPKFPAQVEENKKERARSDANPSNTFSRGVVVSLSEHDEPSKHKYGRIRIWIWIFFNGRPA